jgi:hypothetical protein
MLFAALKLEKDKKKKNIDQVFAYGQCVKAEQRARVGKWVCQVSKTAGMEVVHRDLRLAQLATLRLEARWRRPRHADQRTPDPTWLPAIGSGQRCVDRLSRSPTQALPATGSATCKS